MNSRERLKKRARAMRGKKYESDWCAAAKVLIDAWKELQSGVVEALNKLIRSTREVLSSVEMQEFLKTAVEAARAMEVNKDEP
jgi:hypothetical protein